MAINKHGNWKYNGDVPYNLGDRYYSQDKIRDFRYLEDQIGKLAYDLSETSPVRLSGGIVSQGVGDTLDITECVGYVPYEVTIPDTFSSFPPSKKSADITLVRVHMPAQTNMAIPGATLDGSTTNYVKLKYKETGLNARARAKLGGSYNYEEEPSYEVTVNSTSPTSYEILLATFVGNSGGSFTVTQNYNTTTLVKQYAPTSYAPYYVQSSAPASPYHGWLWYDTNDNKLYQYSAHKSDWIEIDWQTAIKATPEWQAGKLRIGTDGILEIADGQTTPVWYDCYPLIGGAKQIHIQNTAKLYYIPLGCSAKITNSNVIPITPCNIPYDIIFPDFLDGHYVLHPSGVTTRPQCGSFMATRNDGSGTTGHIIGGDTHNGIQLSYYSEPYKGFRNIRLILSQAGHYTVFGNIPLSSVSGGHSYNYQYSGLINYLSTDYYIGTLSDSIYNIIVERK